MLNLLGVPFALTPHERGIPGLTAAGRAALDSEAPALVREAIARGERVSTLILHVEGGAVTLERRDELAAHLRACGMSSFARKVERALVPTSAVLVLVDTDGATGLVLLPLRLFTGGVHG